MRTVVRHIVRFSRDRKARLYWAACICLLVVAARLRFHALPEHYLRHGEAVAANNAMGTFSETIAKTRYRNSSPLLYPLALWVVQKVDISIFRVRVLTVCVAAQTGP